MKQLFLTTLILSALSASSQHFYLFAGTYSTGGSKGIYVFDFNASNGYLQLKSTADNAENPSYLDLTKNGNYLYAVNETGGDKPGALSAFQFDKKNGTLKFLNTQPTSGDHPCYVDVNPGGEFAVAANYSGGNLSIFPVKDGMLQPSVQTIQHTGTGANKMRQEKAHVHMTLFSPDGKYVLATDLGTDKITSYPFNPKAAKPLDEANAKVVSVSPGSGPRHLSFHPNGKFVYLIEELSGRITAFQYHDGQLKAFQSINAHPADYSETKGSADIHVSPDGNFLYASNRAASNTIGIFSIDKHTGTLKSVGFQPTLGTTPRNFVIDPTGKYLLVANQQSNNIVVFTRNKESGLLAETGIVIEVPSPVCLKFLKK